MFKWLWGFFRKKPPSLEMMSKDQVVELAVASCQQVALTEKYVGAGHWEEIDACNEAMKVFMQRTQDRYILSKGNLIVAMKTIRKNKWMMLQGRVI